MSDVHTSSGVQTTSAPVAAAPAPVIHEFALAGVWSGDLRTGKGQLQADSLDVAVTVPAAFGGTIAGSNPEELLLGAAASCFLITLRAVLAGRGVDVAELAVTTRGRFVSEGRKLSLESIEHAPLTRLTPGSSGPETESLVRACYKIAEGACMVTRALSVPVTVRVPGDELGGGLPQ